LPINNHTKNYAKSSVLHLQENSSLKLFYWVLPSQAGTETIALHPTFGSFTLLEPVSLVKVFRLFRLERIFLCVQSVDIILVDVQHLIYWQGQRVCDAFVHHKIRTSHTPKRKISMHTYLKAQLTIVQQPQVPTKALQAWYPPNTGGY
jgi:hypothetical protein